MACKNPAAVALGKLGGAARSDAKTVAARANATKGGRPVGYSPQIATLRLALIEAVDGLSVIESNAGVPQTDRQQLALEELRRIILQCRSALMGR